MEIGKIVKGALAAVTATFVGVLSPFKELTGEIVARTQPILLDLAISAALRQNDALWQLSPICGIICGSRPDRPNHSQVGSDD